MGHTVTVSVIAPKDWKHKDCVGRYLPETHTIEVRRTYRTETEHIYMHELTHCVLSLMSHALNDNEEFVNTFSGLLHQALTSAKFPGATKAKRAKPKAD